VASLLGVVLSEKSLFWLMAWIMLHPIASRGCNIRGFLNRTIHLHFAAPFDRPSEEQIYDANGIHDAR
jgi:hypothetical protein